MGKKPRKSADREGQYGIAPVHYPEIRRRYLCGEPMTAIAESLGFAYDTLRSYIHSRLEPELTAIGFRHVGIIQAEITQLKFYAWDQLNQGKDAIDVTIKEGLVDDVLELVEKVKSTAGHKRASTWTGVIQWCIDMEAKLAGYYKYTNTSAGSTRFRVAGRSRNDTNTRMLAKIEQLTRERHAKLEAASKFL